MRASVPPHEGALPPGSSSSSVVRFKTYFLIVLAFPSALLMCSLSSSLSLGLSRVRAVARVFGHLLSTLCCDLALGSWGLSCFRCSEPACWRPGLVFPAAFPFGISLYTVSLPQDFSGSLSKQLFCLQAFLPSLELQIEVIPKVVFLLLLLFLLIRGFFLSFLSFFKM